MTELSPAAQAVYVAFEDATTPEAALAAALRAVVAHTKEQQGTDIWFCDAEQLLAIADELEGK